MRLKIERLTAPVASVVLGVVSLLYLAAGLQTGLNGNQVWRQADSYAQTLGFLGFKDMQPLQVFNGGVQVFDMPVYQLLVVAITKFTHADPLVISRIVNMGFWVVLLVGGYVIAERVLAGSGLWFVALVTTSPLLLHYYSAPIPDAMCLSLSIAGAAVFLALPGRPAVAGASALIGVSAFMKSPIAFVVVVFLVLRVLIAADRGGRRASVLRLAPVLATALVGAAGAEQVRKAIMHTSDGGFAQDPSWYFGTLQERVSGDYWATMVGRTGEAFALGVVAIVVVAAIVAGILLAGRSGPSACSCRHSQASSRDGSCSRTSSRSMTTTRWR